MIYNLEKRVAICFYYYMIRAGSIFKANLLMYM